jgi:hypothetical protein
MSIKNFSNELFMKCIMDSSTKEYCATFDQPANAAQLAHIRLLMYFEGQFTSESVELYCTDSIGSPTFTHQSASVKVTSLSDSLSLPGAKWMGWVRFDFDRQWIPASDTWIIQVGGSAYTKTHALFMGAVFDWPVPVNWTVQESFLDHPIAFQIFTAERV